MESSISLPDEIRVELDAVATAGGYSGPAELIGDMLRDYRERRQALADAIKEGEDSGFVDYNFAEIVAEARTRYQAG